MIWFIFLFFSLITGLVYSAIKIYKERKFNLLYIISFINVILFFVIFATA